MTNQITNSKEAVSSDIVRQVFEEFGGALKKSGTPPDVVERLRGLLLSDKSLSEKVVADAIFPEAPTL